MHKIHQNYIAEAIKILQSKHGARWEKMANLLIQCQKTNSIDPQKEINNNNVTKNDITVIQINKRIKSIYDMKSCDVYQIIKHCNALDIFHLEQPKSIQYFIKQVCLSYQNICECIRELKNQLCEIDKQNKRQLMI